MFQIENIIPIKNDVSLINSYLTCKKFLNENDINKIFSVINKQQLFDSNLTTGGIINKNENIRKCKHAAIPVCEETKWFYNKIIEIVKNINNKYWKFNINKIGESQYLQYDINGKFDWHLDIGKNYNNRKISLSLLLNDNYEGGEFEVFRNNITETITINKGDLLLFPSFLLHRVKPVTKGIRKVIVIWIHGEPFR